MTSIYSCHSDTSGQAPRSKQTESLMQAGWTYQQRGDHITREPVMKIVISKWIEMSCGATKEAGYADANCIGCTKRQDT